MSKDTYIVVCRDDRVGRRKGRYVLATRRIFETSDAAATYAAAIAHAREPLVIAGRFTDLVPTRILRMFEDLMAQKAETLALMETLVGMSSAKETRG